MKPAIDVDKISKSYQISHQTEVTAGYDTLKDDFARLVKKPFGGGEEDTHETFWALKDVSFQIQPGETFGVIGKNGSGKSTLLKILSRIVDPTKGMIHINGRVASLLEVGTGFHPELTGRENIYFNGSMLGMGRQEIQQKFNQIVEFSEIEKFLDTPVKFYSSGMYVRLAFAVAAHLEPEILILDEVLSVGDAQFQKKSMAKMLNIAKQGCTILFVSHSMMSVEQLCDRAMLLKKGRVEFIGNTEEVTEKYLSQDMTPEEKIEFLRAKKEQEFAQSPTAGLVKIGKLIKVRAAKHVISDFKINGQALDQRIEIPSGSPITIEAKYHNDGLPSDLLIGYGIKSEASHNQLIFTHNKLENVTHETGKSGAIKATILTPRLAPGNYSINIHVWLDNKMFVEDKKICTFRIEPAPAFASKEAPAIFPSALLIDSKWSISGK